MCNIRRNLDSIRDAIQKAEAASGRTHGSVKLMAVSKFHPASAVIEAINAGQLLFGENRVQEASEKFTAIHESIPNADLHIIGSLQRNKVKQALTVSSCIQSVDRVELLDEIQKQAQKICKTIKVLFEIHTGEESKSGFASSEDLALCIEQASHMQNIDCAGFMTMAPFTGDEKVIRGAFTQCRETAEKMKNLFPALPLNELSMGMSSDYRIAIEEGSTLVRIGTAIFGERTKIL
jgi:pyridoxal phosphate enzyme (YggS family)